MADNDDTPSGQDITAANLVQYWTAEYQRLMGAGVPIREIGAAFMELAIRVEASVHGPALLAQRLAATAEELEQLAEVPRP
jgi:hypothetical protein